MKLKREERLWPVERRLLGKPNVHSQNLVLVKVGVSEYVREPVMPYISSRTRRTEKWSMTIVARKQANGFVANNYVVAQLYTILKLVT